MKKLCIILCTFLSILAVSAQNQPEVPADIRQWLDGELEKSVRKSPINIYSDAFFDETPARLVGYLKGYNPESDLNVGKVIVENPVKNERYPMLVKIMPDGRFMVDLPMWNPVYTYVWFNEEPFACFYIEPGLTVGLIMDLEKEKKKAVGFLGPLAEINRELQMVADSVPQPDPYLIYNKGREMPPMDFQAEWTHRFQGYKDKFDAFVSSRPISRKAQQIMGYEILCQYASKLLEYEMLNRHSEVSVGIPAEYYDFLGKMPLDNPLLLISSHYESFLNRFEYSGPFLKVPRISVYKSYPDKTIPDFLQERNFSLTPLEAEIARFHYFIRITRQFTPSEFRFMQDQADSIAAFGEKFDKELDQYDSLYLKPLSEHLPYEMKLLEWDEKDKIVSDTLGLRHSMTYEIIKVRSLQKYLSGPGRKPEEAELFTAAMQEQLTHPYLKKQAGELLREYRSKINNQAHELPDGKAADIFRKIISNHRGKYLVVDFWATTCGPCIGDLRESKVVREKYKDHPEIDFIFITGEGNSPREDYNKMVESQGLFHSYRLPQNEYLYLPALFKFSGIPHYVLVDKDGKIVKDDFSEIRGMYEKVIEQLLNPEDEE